MISEPSSDQIDIENIYAIEISKNLHFRYEFVYGTYEDIPHIMLKMGKTNYDISIALDEKLEIGVVGRPIAEGAQDAPARSVWIEIDLEDPATTPTLAADRIVEILRRYDHG